MKVRSFTTTLIKLNTYLPFFPLDHPGQLVTSFHDDDIKEILYDNMPNMWKKKNVEQGHNYFYNPIHSMAEFFETKIKKLKKSIPPNIPSRSWKKNKKWSKKRKLVIFDDSEDEGLDQGYKGKKFCQYHGTCRHTADQCTTLKTLVKQKKTEEDQTLQEKEKVHQV